MVASLYTSPFSLAVGAMCGVVVGLVCAIGTGSLALWIATGLITLISIFRVSIAYRHARATPESVDFAKLELLYESGAWAFSLMFGLITTITILTAADPRLHVLATANTIGYAAGISGRNAGRPVIAIGQLALSVTPVTLALLLSGQITYQILAVTIILFAFAMVQITRNTFMTVRESADAAERNAQLAEKMKQFARTDVVTGLLNRAGLNSHLLQLFSDPVRSQQTAIFWLDLDRFKEVNDTLGHPVGDQLLSEVSRRLERVAGKDSIIARFGGDEFIIVSQGFDTIQLQERANALLQETTRSMRIDGQRLQIGVSIGVARAPDDGVDLETLMQSADLALYHSKVNGRNQATFFQEAMTRDLIRRREIEAELRGAIEREELTLYFQPIVDLKTGHIRSFEALVRWFHPDKGELHPTEFIQVAEETGLIITLGNWITARACEAAASWPDHISVCVNISPVQMRSPGAALGILRALQDARLAPERLELEVTESVFLEAEDVIYNFMNHLQDHGVRFALDDFGTGYSSLTYLQRFSFSKIKVDRSFVSGPNVSNKSDAIIRAVAGMATTLEMQIVAEGIETAGHVNTVIAAGCTLGQGYFYSRPVPEVQAVQMIAEELETFGDIKRALIA